MPPTFKKKKKDYSFTLLAKRHEVYNFMLTSCKVFFIIIRLPLEFHLVSGPYEQLEGMFSIYFSWWVA